MDTISELVIQTSNDGADIALLQNDKLVEVHKEKFTGQFNVGDVHYGKVKKVMPGLRAAFVDIGHEKDAFLHYHDLGPDIPTFLSFLSDIRSKKVHTHLLSAYKFKDQIHKDGEIGDVLKPGDRIVVQIQKEPISSKGPRLTSQLSIPGRYLILIPFADNVSVSKKIGDPEDRKRLKDIIKSIKPKGFGVIVRTVSSGKSVTELDADLRELVQKWKNIYQGIREQKNILLKESQRVELLLRDIVNDSFKKITVDNKPIHDELKKYLKSIAPEKASILELYEPQKDRKLFSELGISKQLQSLFGKIVNIGGGAYLVIEHTEAMHVVDVNSGSKRVKDAAQDESALRTNMEAAHEIARQLRLRDMGGIIVIDFIDMRSVEHRKEVYNAMKQAMDGDRAKHTILQLSKFGLMQITRQRVRPEKQNDEKSTCPLCKGSGHAAPSLQVAEEVANRLREKISETSGSIKLMVHPYIHAFLTKGIPSIRASWVLKYKRWISISSNDELAITHFDIS